MTQSRNKRQKLSKKKHWILNLFDEGCPSQLSPGSWALPQDEGRNYTKLDHWIKIAKLAEKGKLNAVFIADVLGPYDVYNGPHNFDAVARSGAQFPLVDPTMAVSAMALATKNVGFGLTFSTISEVPYHFARRIATLDHLTGGRVAWNIVTTYLESAARNLLNGEPLPPHDQRYERAEEYVESIYELLLSSWRDDAIVTDVAKRTYAEPSRIREINYEGKYFKIPGPHVTEPSPQRLPVISQAGTSSKGKEFAAKHGEIIFVSAHVPEQLTKTVNEIKDLAVNKYHRNLDNLKFISSIFIVVAKTDEEAEIKLEEYRKYLDTEGTQALIGGWTGINLGKYTLDEDLENVTEDKAMHSAVNNFLHDNKGKKTRRALSQNVGVGAGKKRMIVGSPTTVADEMERWLEVGGTDGFNLSYASFPETFENIIELLIPELRKRGHVWDDYPVPGGTFRENLYGKEGQTFVPEDHVAYGYKWTEGTRDEFKNKLETYKASLKK